MIAFGLQDVLATAAAIAAVVVIVRRIAGTVRPSIKPACANCPLADAVTKTAK